MEKDKVYPKNYTEPTKVAVDKEAQYTALKKPLGAMVKAIVGTTPVLKEEIIKELIKQEAPGNSHCWKRAIEDVELEWHPDKYKEKGVI